MPYHGKIIIGSLGVIVIIAGLWLGYVRADRANNWVKAEATITHVEVIMRSPGKQEPDAPNYIPWIEYQSNSNKKIHLRMEKYYYTIPYYRKGMKLSILYDPKKPEDIYILTKEFWQFSVGMVLFGIFMLIILPWIRPDTESYDTDRMAGE